MTAKQKLSSTRSLLILALMSVLSLCTTAVWAANGAFDTPKQAFSWYSKGQGCMHLKLMTTNANPVLTLHAATYGVRDDKGNKTPVLYVGEYESSFDGFVRSDFKNLLSDESLLWLTNDTKYKPLCLITGGEVQRHDATRTGKDDGYTELDWYYPVKFAGKKYTFYVEATLWHGGGATEPYSKDIGTMEFDAVSFETYDAIPGTESGEEGTVKIPFVSDRPINYVDASYTDSDGNTKNVPRITMPKNTYNGFLRLPATEKHDNLKLTANILAANISGSEIPNPEWPSQLKGNIEKTIAKVAQVHNPRYLTAQMDSVGAVVLKWQIGDTDATDIMDGDIFQIQRSLTGRTEDYKTLPANVMFSTSQTNYTFRDSLLMSELDAEQIDKELGILVVRYRVFRAATQQLWGADKNPCVAYAMPQMSTLTLLTPTNAKAEWLNRSERTVKVT